MTAISVGHVVAGKYQIERLVARGGMGSVWAARHLQLDTMVAVEFEGAPERSGCILVPLLLGQNQTQLRPCVRVAR